MAKEAVKPTKVVVRLLPPLITENELMGTIGDEHKSNVSIQSFVPGRRVKGESKPSRNATCYLYFGDTDQADLFIRAYHGHAFVDDLGQHFRAVACYAPYQKVPKQKSAKEDPREGKIEEDAMYKQFLETLAKPKEAFVAPEDPKLAAKPLDPSATPLLQHLRDKAKERRERAEKKANRKWKSQMDSIGEDEEPRKKGKWFCGECGTTKKLEEDPDDRGTSYCTHCWESWETTDWDSKPKKKKKKNKYYEEVEEVVEETSSSRKSKKKKDKEAAHDWYGEEASKDQASEGRRRRKKKEKEEEWWDEGSNSYWKESDEGYSREKKSKSKREKIQWVEVDSKEKKPKAEEDPPASRWRKKGASAEEETQEEKPRRSRRSKAKEDDYWY